MSAFASAVGSASRLLKCSCSGMSCGGEGRKGGIIGQVYTGIPGVEMGGMGVGMDGMGVRVDSMVVGVDSMGAVSYTHLTLPTILLV
eukprot:8948929-Pyramimonas_sp.AAC.1